MNRPQTAESETSRMTLLGDAVHTTRVFGMWYRLAAIETAIYVTPLIALLYFVGPAPLTGAVSLHALSLSFVLTVALFFAVVRHRGCEVTDLSREINRGIWNTWREATQTERGHTRAIACNLAFLAAAGSAYLTVTAVGTVQATAGTLSVVTASAGTTWAVSSLAPLTIGCLFGLCVLAGGFRRFVEEPA